LIRELDWSSKLNGDWSFLMHLHGLGRRRTDKWLAANFDDIGVKSTVDLQAKCRSRRFAVSGRLPAWLPIWA
jgi:NTE family protein